MQHIPMTCENHPTLRWSCKSIAVTPTGRYNGARNIFYNGDGESYPPECDCPASALIAAIPLDELARIKAED